MAEINRVALFGKLNKVAYRAIESATVFCKMRGNPYVELVHWLHQILHHVCIDDAHRRRREQHKAERTLTEASAVALDDGPDGGHAQAALAASIFHFRETTVGRIKSRLLELGIPVRPPSLP